MILKFLFMQVNKYKFYKNGEEWYIDLPDYLEAGGSIGELQMIEGADIMLDVIAGTDDTVTLFISTEMFEGADVLILKEKCDPIKGGGYYFLAEFEGRTLNQLMWLCGVTAYVLGDIPPNIYLKRDT